MGFILTLVFIAAAISGLTWLLSDRDHAANTFCSAVICTIIGVVITSVVIFISYCDYVGAKQDYVNIQKTTSRLISTYAAYANVPTGTKAPRLASDLTDKKYEDYQDNLRYYITKVYNKIESYNDTVVGKEFVKQSWYWNWVIYYPEKLPALELPVLPNL